MLTQARGVQRAWGGLPVGARRRALGPLAGRLRQRADEVARAVEGERGTPVAGALAGEVLGAVELIAHWLGTIEQRLAVDELAPHTLRSRRKEGRASREARGVVALIGAAHEPIVGPLRTLVPALLAGNAVVFAPGAPGCGRLVVSLFEGLAAARAARGLVGRPGRAGGEPGRPRGVRVRPGRRRPRSRRRARRGSAPARCRSSARGPRS